jgi:hypothetical protein
MRSNEVMLPPSPSCSSPSVGVACGSGKFRASARRSSRRCGRAARAFQSKEPSSPAGRLRAPDRHPPVGKRLGDVDALDAVAAVEIGQRARDAQHAVIAARR